MDIVNSICASSWPIAIADLLTFEGLGCVDANGSVLLALDGYPDVY